MTALSGRFHRLTLLDGRYAIGSLPPDSPVPAWAVAAPFASITRTADELSIVCREEDVPPSTRAEGGWRLLRVEGPFPLQGTIGVLAGLAGTLAQAGVSIFAVSTFDTDYILVPATQLETACAALCAAGHEML